MFSKKSTTIFYKANLAERSIKISKLHFGLKHFESESFSIEFLELCNCHSRMSNNGIVRNLIALFFIFYSIPIRIEKSCDDRISYCVLLLDMFSMSFWNIRAVLGHIEYEIYPIF